MNARQRKNLLKLAGYLESLPEDYEHFHMQYYTDHRGGCELPMGDDLYAAKKPQEFLANCGTVACAVGHGPASGIAPIASEFKSSLDFDWGRYANRVFGTSPFSHDFGFLFGSPWSRIDDTHYGAAARIRYYLTTSNRLYTEHSAVRKYAPYRKGSRSAVRRAIDASVDTLPQGRDAKQGSVRSKGSAVAKPDAQTTSDQPHD